MNKKVLLRKISLKNASNIKLSNGVFLWSPKNRTVPFQCQLLSSDGTTGHVL